jgi:hypothetical protein
MTASLKLNIARIDRLFNEAVSPLPQATRVVAVTVALNRRMS